MDVTPGRLNGMMQSSALMVTNYGANSAGTADAAAGIQLALNLARDLGGAQVVVPPGVYRIDTTLRIYNNTRLTLLAGAEFRRNVAGTLLINGDSGQAFGGYTGHSRIVIEGGLWNMRGTTAGLTASAMCISIGHATDVTIRDLEIRDLPGYHAIELNSTLHGRIIGCQFRGYVDPGGRDFSEAVQIDLAKSAAEFGGFGPYDHTPCEDISVTGCHFGASGTAGTTAWPRGVGSHSATITKWHRRIRVSDCSFENVLQYAISAYNWEDTVISGNTFVNCGSGVRIRTVILSDPEDTKDTTGASTGASQNMRNVVVSGNSFRGGLAYDEPIIALGETSGTILNLSITGNTIDGTTSGQHGIRMQYVSRAVVVGNVVANVNGTGISTEDGNNLLVNDNEVWTPASHGITFVNCSHSSAIGNQIRDPGNNGILIQGGNDLQIRSNYIKAPGRATNATWYAVRLSTSASAVSISGNKARPNGSGNEARHGLSVSGTCTLIQRYGNDWRGSQWTGAASPDGAAGIGVNIETGATENTSSADLST
ncbi:right-handed parallel beta-helix repeat-containing protein [Streptomyces sp. NPDC002952]|uniref:right-handed parallel beta-helix repeat-containing protein n=1 Tax=Streptomyces sp. NPDC002952 TaxID=3364673 RepID=UPI0036890AAB